MRRPASSGLSVRNSRVLPKNPFAMGIPLHVVHSLASPCGFWTHAHHRLHSRPRTSSPPNLADFDLLIAADCLYASRDFDSFFATVSFLLDAPAHPSQEEAGLGSESPPGGRGGGAQGRDGGMGGLGNGANSEGGHQPLPIVTDSTIGRSGRLMTRVQSQKIEKSLLMVFQERGGSCARDVC